MNLTISLQEFNDKWFSIDSMVSNSKLIGTVIYDTEEYVVIKLKKGQL